MVQHIGLNSASSDPQRIEFLWVRWYGRDTDSTGGWNTRRLHKVGFMDSDDDAAFGFLDPARIIRGAHLIPSFCDGRTRELLQPSQTARAPSENDEDYTLYNVGMFVDRDMIMRFRGGGVGHKSTREATNIFLNDRHKSDQHYHNNNEAPEEEEAEAKADIDSSSALGDEEEDYGYQDPTEQRLSETESDAEGEDQWNDDDAFDGLGPEDGEKDSEGIENLLGGGDFNTFMHNCTASGYMTLTCMVVQYLVVPSC